MISEFKPGKLRHNTNAVEFYFGGVGGRNDIMHKASGKFALGVDYVNSREVLGAKQHHVMRLCQISTRANSALSARQQVESVVKSSESHT